MKLSLAAIPLTLASSVLALPAAQIFEKRSPLCGANNFCAVADAQRLVNDLKDMNDRQINVGKSWTQLVYYSNCYVWAHSGSGSAESTGEGVGNAAQDIVTSCPKSGGVSGANTVGSNFYLFVGTAKPS